ncbi:MAG: hypothetical protein ABJG41_01270 [Cyclobacteriaceae bacterium]
MTFEFIVAILGSNLITGISTSLITVWANKRLRKSEEKSNEAQAADLLSKTYAALIKDLNGQLNNLKSINKELEDHKDKLMIQLQQLESEVDSLRKQVVKLTNRLKKYEE